MELKNMSKDLSSTLDDVSKLLNKADIQLLVSQCLKIKPSRQKLVTTAKDLFAELQGRGMPQEDLVDHIIGLMRRCNMKGASDILKDYRGKQLTKKDGIFPKHKEAKSGYVCLTCCSKSCEACTLNPHDGLSNCEIVPPGDVRPKIMNERMTLSNKLNEMKLELAAIEDRCKNIDALLKSRSAEGNDEIDFRYALLLDQGNKHKLNLLKRLAKMEMFNAQTLLSMTSQLDEAKEDLRRMKNVPAALGNGHQSASKLMQISESVTKIDKISIETEEQGKLFSKIDRPLYFSIQNHCKFIKLHFNSVIGTIPFEKNQFIKVIDRRLDKGGVDLVLCRTADPGCSQMQHLRHKDLAASHGIPIVVSSNSGFFDGKQCILLAVGEKVFIVLVPTDEQNALEAESVISCNELKDDSWITSISFSHTQCDSRDSLFIISESSSSILREYKVCGKLVGTIDMTNLLPNNNFTYASRGEDVIALIADGCDYVILVRVNNKLPYQGGSLKSPSLRCKSPNIVTRANGSHWLVLFVSNSEPNEWEVALYNHAGDIVKPCLASSSEQHLQRAVSMSVIGEEAFVCLDNDSMLTFNLPF